MSYEDARRLVRRSVQLMSPHLLHGLVVGDVDVDNLLDGIEVDAGDDPLLHDDNDVEDEVLDAEGEAEEALDQERMQEEALDQERMQED
jgi:hypothetical protein